MKTIRVKELFLSVRDRLHAGGVDSSNLEAEWILSHVLQLDPIDRIRRPERIVKGEEMAAIDGLLARRLTGEPLAYILGEKEFFGLKFKVNSNVLIPRPETEHLVERAIEWVRDHYLRNETVDMLELGVGSGCITVTLLHLLPEVRATAIDISDGAIEVAFENAKAYGVENRIKFLRGDAAKCSQLLEGKRFDVVLANPPYIDEVDPRVEPGVKAYEPHIALFSPGRGGVEIAARWIAELRNLVKSGRAAAGFEFGSNQARMVEQLFYDSKVFTHHDIIQDYAGHDRLIWAEREG